MGEHQPLSADVVVVGAGASGLPAAIGAARAGAKVILLEEDQVIGGAPVDYYVCLFYGGPITGILKEVEDLLISRYSPVPHAQLFLPGSYQHAWWELVSAESNLQVITGARVTRALVSDQMKVEGVVVEVGVHQTMEIRSAVTIDATGSGTVCALAGCEERYGREGKDEFDEPSAPEHPDDEVQTCTWMYFAQRLPDSALVTMGEILGQGKGEGIGSGVGVLQGIPPRGHAGRWPPGVEPGPDPGLYLHWGCSIRCRDTRDPIELGKTQAEALQAMSSDHARLRERGYMIYLAPRIGVRESRRIVGDYIITENNIREGVFPEDTIALADYGLDIWREQRVDMHQLETARYGIPYRALLPRGVEGLLVVGKCMSGTHIAQSSFRVMPIAGSAGQAAGVAAALAARARVSPRRLDVRDIQRTLRAPEQHVQLEF